MSQWAGGVLTAAGRALQAKVEAGTTALVLTKIKLGDGTEGMDAVDNLTDLVGAKAVLGISSSVADGDHATITGVIISSQLQAGFWCREWGLFATDPDEGEILYMITIDSQPEW
ncbi:phage tail protein, partial [Anaerovibrio sp.]|uniref:phage tail-collar fiber domain-containing protein n=1 Tax=Anaerovibrio sp. TaxID=1872532 RepID=UPI0025BD6BDB